jgi:RNA polymerase sigma-70 factor, ECF subfamily
VILKDQRITDARQAVTTAVRHYHGRLLAILIKDLRDFQLAEDCLQDATESALIHWERNGLPHAPAAWLLQVARRKALDRLRRAKNFKEKSAEILILMDIDQSFAAADEDEAIPDERLRLIFTCCHPALDAHTCVALSLRTLCGLSTVEIARAFVVSEEAMAQRLVRARQKISNAGISYLVPDEADLPSRMQSVLSTIYLTFNEGYAATNHSEHIRVDLCEEAIRLARLLCELCPHEAEAKGLLALLLLTHARRNARSSKLQSYIPLEEQDRSLWDGAMIAEGDLHLVTALQLARVGSYQLQAAISAVHAEARNHSETRWDEIVSLYEQLITFSDNPVYRLNRAVALSYLHHPTNALAVLNELSHELQSYQPYYAARADVLRRLNDNAGARLAYEQAIALSQSKVEQDFLRHRMRTFLS